MPQENNANETTTNTKAQGQGKKQGKPAKEPKAAKEPKPKKEKAVKPPREPKPKKEKPVRATPAHLAKVDKVAGQLPALSEDATAVVAAASNMSTADICSTIAHLQIAVRRRGIVAIAQGQARGDGKLEPGGRVRIKSSQNPRFIGATGTLDKVQRIRCYVKLDGKEYAERDGRPTGDYFFTSDVELLSAPASGGNTAEVLKRLTQPAAGVDIHEILESGEGAEEPTGT
jgi:hypothetical protein